MNTALRLTRNIALVFLALLVLATIVVTRLWQERAAVADIGWPTAAPARDANTAVTVTWLGISTLLFDDGDTQILIDDTFTRIRPTDLAPLQTISSDVAAINYALYDLLGKTLNVPLYALLGGLYRNRVLAAVEVPGGPPEEMAAHSVEYYNQGIRGIKAKVGTDPDRDAQSLKAIREALGDEISLRADANRRYTVHEAIRFCRLAEEYDVGLELLEQPTANTDFEGARRISDTVHVPVEADEAADSLQQVFQLLKNDACDIINTKCSKAGGISGVKKWAAVAEAAEKPIVIGTEYGLGSIVASKVHLGCAIKNADPVVEFTEIMLHDLLVKNPLELRDGYIEVPTGPGIGWEFDNEKIEEYTVRDFPD